VVYLRDGQAAGILPALFTRLESMTGDHYELRLVPWTRALAQAQRGEGGITNFTYTSERAQQFDFSQPLYADDIVLVTLKSAMFPFHGLEDLKGKVLGGRVGASYGEAFDQAAAQGMFSMQRDRGEQSRLFNLLAHKADAAVIPGGALGVQLLMASHPMLYAQRSSFVILNKPLVHDPLHLAFAKSMGKQEALNRVNTALQELKNSGELDRIAAQAVNQSAAK